MELRLSTVGVVLFLHYKYFVFCFWGWVCFLVFLGWVFSNYIFLPSQHGSLVWVFGGFIATKSKTQRFVSLYTVRPTPHFIYFLCMKYIIPWVKVYRPFVTMTFLLLFLYDCFLFGPLNCGVNRVHALNDKLA